MNQASTKTQASTKRRNAVLAGAAGVALLLGGSTYALWSDTAEITGGTIHAGDLALGSVELTQWDVSADRYSRTGETIANIMIGVDPSDYPLTFATGQVQYYNGTASTDGADGDRGPFGVKVSGDDELQGHAIDLDTWMITPGDTAAMVATTSVTLAGDNLVAELAINGSAFLPDIPENEGLTYHFAIFDEAGAQVGSIAAITGATDQRIALFQAPNAGQGGVDDRAGSPLASIKVADGTVSVTVVVLVHFNANTSGTTYTNASDLLGSIDLNLNQVREGTDGFGLV